MADRRFVILRHEDAEGVHFDLMIEDGARLATWKSATPPETARRGPVVCRRIGDHRALYLDYEGPVSGDRGYVRRHDVGTCTIVDRVDDDGVTTGRWVIEIRGAVLAGRFELRQSAPGDMAWSLSRLDS